MLSFQNLEKAINAVKRNKGRAGVDGMKVNEIESYMRQNWMHIEEQILARTYKPQPVRRVGIHKDNGGVRLLGVPCVIDRVIQQAMVQVLAPVFEPTFSDYSYGFRPNRSAEDAMRKAQEYMAAGYKHVVDLDLSKFFDRVNHDYLMTLVDNTLKDKDIRRLIFVCLKSGIMCNGCLIPSEEGTPLGGPFPLMLSNIYLPPYDKELERRGRKFVRYADDCNIFTKSKYACNRVKESVIRFLEGKMKLKVNTEKTEARRVEGASFLGFTIMTRVCNGGLGYCRPKDKKRRKFEGRIREITCRSRGVAFSDVVCELNAYIRGWINYYARSNISNYIEAKASWIRRRLRQYLWKQWKTPDNRRDTFRKLGIAKWKLDIINLCSSCRWYKMSSFLSPYITNDILLNTFNLIDIVGEYKRLHRERRLLDRTYNSQLEFVFI